MESQRQNQRPQRQSRPRGGSRAGGQRSERPQRENSNENRRQDNRQNQQQHQGGERNQQQQQNRRPRLPHIYLRRKPEEIKLNEEQAKQVEELTQQINAFGKIEIPDTTALTEKDQQYQNEIDRLSSQMSNINDKLEDVQRRQDNYEKSHNPHKQESNEAYETMKKLDEQIKPLVAKRDEIKAQRIQTSTKVRSIKQSTPGRSKDDILDKISQLEYQIETQTLSNQQLRTKMSEIDKLKKSMGQFGNLNDYEAQFSQLTIQERELNDKISALFDQKNKLRDTLATLNKDNKDIKSEIDKFWAERKQLYQQRNELREKINKLYQEKRSFKQEFYNKRNELFQKRDDQAVLIHKRNQIYQEAERHMDLLEKGARQAGEIKERHNPNEANINAARSLVSYLQGILALEEAKLEEEEEKTHLQGKAQNDSALQLVMSVRKASKKDKKAAKKEKKNEEKQKSNKLDLTFESLQQFSSLGVTQPTTKDQIPEVIAVLKKKAQEWEDSFIKLNLTFNVQADGSIKSAITVA